MNKHRKKLRIHDSICSLVSEVLHDHGIPNKLMVEYSVGELDVLAFSNGARYYFEIKSNYTRKSENKAREQIIRAIEHNMCDYGFLVSKQGLFDVLGACPYILP
jgi:hypothetical protein